MTPEFLKNYQAITLKPEDFPKFLCEELGFVLLHTRYLSEEEGGEKKKKKKKKEEKEEQTSFTQRPIYVFQRK